MPNTVVGLFENAQLVDDAVREIEALGFPVQEVRRITEPDYFEVTGVMSFPRLDFEVDLSRELTRIGATKPEVQAYVEGLRRGGALALATGTTENVEAAGKIMDRHGAVQVEEVTGSEPRLPAVMHQSMASTHDSPVTAGRIGEQFGGAHVFVW